MAGIEIKNFADQRFTNSMCDVLQKFIPEGVVIVSVSMVEDPGNGKRILQFMYSRVSEGMVVRQRGGPDASIPRYPVEISVPIWNTHIDTDQILAKFALVR